MKSKRYATIALVLFLAAGAGSAFGQGRFRNILSTKFRYYTDERFGLEWEEVFIAPLPKGFYLVAAADGTNTSVSDVTGGRLGLAFDLPGAFYGEGSYKLEYDWQKDELKHTALVSCTYESGPAMASLSLSGEFTPSSAGGVLSPALSYALNPDLRLSTTLFLAFHHYSTSESFFNIAALAFGEYRLGPQIFLSLGGTFGTVYEPAEQYAKWSVLGGIKVVPSDVLSVKTLIEYENASASPVNPHDIISALLVVDVKFRKAR